ncbi:TRAP transporter substrate-binding protein [Paenalcaligenes suwonensis]|uniref:TRAP transporter substrate-binding protein n=1 Tax=Paenalcaligenes suwonensis TaxID=1202713 RepID=UPI00140A9FDB|nr:TRAP transporter substrate-binding protein [Paenalcaligenes suwonensis]NHC61147.1 TRAP transporter substrate-binding protein [Paenalcaligenes suwonensis]
MKSSIKKSLLSLALPVMMACSPQVLANDIQERTFRFSFVQPIESHMGYGAQKFAELVKEKSDGKMTVRLFPNGTLGGDLQTVSSLQGGTLDITTMPPGLLVGLDAKYSIFDLPFLFQDSTEADAVLDGPVGNKYLEALPTGLVGLGYWDHGFRNISNSKHPVNKLEDLKGLKIRVLETPLVLDSFSALGTNAVPMAFTELYTAMETGAVDGQDNPVVAFETNKFDEVQKHLALTRHIYNPLILLFSERTWNKLSDAERQVLMDAARDSKDEQRRVSREMEAKALTTIQANGTQVTSISPDEINRMREATQTITDKYTPQIGSEAVTEIMTEITKIRSK